MLKLRSFIWTNGTIWLLWNMQTRNLQYTHADTHTHRDEDVRCISAHPSCIRCHSGRGERERGRGIEGMMLFCTKWNEAVKDTEEGSHWHTLKCNSSMPQFFFLPSLTLLHIIQAGSVPPPRKQLVTLSMVALMCTNAISWLMRCARCLFRKQI